MKMKAFEKMTFAELVFFCFMTICSGVMIGIGGVSYLLAGALFGEWGRLVGACLFSLGIFAIVAFEMKLFTGMIADIPKLGVKNYWKLPVCFLGNIFGVLAVSVFANHTFLSEIIKPRAIALISIKLSHPEWATRALCSSILCGMLITISVKSRYYTKEKGLSSTLGVVFPIIVFAFCGFDHSVANMLYFNYLNEVSWKVIGYISITIAGNVIGGVLFPTITLLREYIERKRNERDAQ